MKNNFPKLVSEFIVPKLIWKNSLAYKFTNVGIIWLIIEQLLFLALSLLFLSLQI